MPQEPENQDAGTVSFYIDVPGLLYLLLGSIWSASPFLATSPQEFRCLGGCIKWAGFNSLHVHGLNGKGTGVATLHN